MKRILTAIIASAALAAATIPASAQSEVLNNPENRAFWGIRASADLSLPGNYKNSTGVSFKMFRPGTGFSIGAIYNMPLVANLYFEPGVNFYYDIFRFDGLSTSAEPGDSPMEYDPPVHKAGFRIPLNIGYHFDIFSEGRGNVSVFTGPEVSLGVSAKIKFKDKNFREECGDIYGNATIDAAENRFDLGWRVGAGLTVGRAYLSVAGSFGLLDLNKSPHITYRENRVYFTLGYNFR